LDGDCGTLLTPPTTPHSRSTTNVPLISMSVSTFAARNARMQLRPVREQRVVGSHRFCRTPIARTAIQVTINERLTPFFDIGRELFERRQGQLNISCAQCHDDNWGKRLGGNIIPQAQPTGYLLYVVRKLCCIYWSRSNGHPARIYPVLIRVGWIPTRIYMC